MSPLPPISNDEPASEQRVEQLLAVAEALEDDGKSGEAQVWARKALVHAIAAESADQVIELFAMLGRLLAFEEDWPGVCEVMEPGLVWLLRAQRPISRVRFVGMLAVAYVSLHQIDRAFGLLRRERVASGALLGEAAYLLELTHGELNIHLGRLSEAINHLRQALHELQRCAPAERTPHRNVIARLHLASALLVHISSSQPPDLVNSEKLLAEARRRLDEAEPLLLEVPVFDVAHLVARAHESAIRGLNQPHLKAGFMALSDSDLSRFLPASVECLFHWVLLEAAAGDVEFARAALEKSNPKRLKLPWPYLNPLWYRALGDVLMAEGDAPAAVAAMRQSILEDCSNREREISLVVTMAEKAAHADEVEAGASAARAEALQLQLSIATLAAEARRLGDSATTDVLTGLRNRRYLEQFIAGLSTGLGLEEWTVVMVDIDHFKSVNDEHSHAVGDRVLVAVARILGAAVRDNDLAVRWGGEEFVLLLRHAVREPRLDAIRLSVASFDWAPVLPERVVTISMGAAQWRTDAAFAAALALADERLYAAKRAGRNRVVAA